VSFLEQMDNGLCQKTMSDRDGNWNTKLGARSLIYLLANVLSARGCSALWARARKAA
jgi:hypothetical protein